MQKFFKTTWDLLKGTAKKFQEEDPTVYAAALALFTAILFTIGKALFSLVLGQTNIATTYGAAGSLAAILFWVFYTSIILLIGAVFTYVYATNIGKKIIPKRNAVKVKLEEVEYDHNQTGKPHKRIKQDK